MAKSPNTGNRKAPAGRLRIVAGKWRSRPLEIADVEGLRPTSERVRETLFNWLAPVIEGSRCLDLFAGTGALGLEALSRGAASVVFVDSSRRALTVIEKNVRSLHAEGAIIRHGDALRFVQTAAPGSFDVVFLDPPFAADLLDGICQRIDEAKILAPGAMVYLERDKAQAEPSLPATWQVLRDKVAGQVRYSLVTAEPQAHWRGK
ncbi:MAG: 16S rRNA (guanine(966)-N(2))-methyltransferase RsmD [Woeseiaceae bacterium]